VQADPIVYLSFNSAVGDIDRSEAMGKRSDPSGKKGDTLVAKVGILKVNIGNSGILIC
jgi:hypothetical protein